MIENILIFMRNCVMAVLTAWAGIQIADKARTEKPVPTPVAATGVALPTNRFGDGSACAKRAGSPGDTPASDASADPDRATPNAQPSVLTIR